MDRHGQTTTVLIISAVLLLASAVLMLGRPARQAELSGTRPITYRIDPNRADADTLCLLPRIGPGMARRILDDRQANGPFEDVGEMSRVQMIGDKTVAAMAPWVRFDPHDDR